MRAIAAALTVAVFAALFVASPAHAAGTAFSSIGFYGDPAPGTSTRVQGFILNGQDTTTTIRCVETVFNTQADGGGTVPAGYSTASVLDINPGSYFTNGTDWTVSSPSNGRLLTKLAAGALPAAGSDRQISYLSLAHSGTWNVPIYAILKTYTDVNCTAGNVVNFGVAVVQYVPPATVSTVVDPSFAFTVAPNASVCSLQSASGYVAPSTASAMDLGRVNSTNVGSSSHSLSTTTNARLGSKVYVRGAQTSNNLRSGTVQPFADSASAPVAGTATFGYTVSDTNSANGTWKALSSNNAQVASSGTGGFTGQCIGFSAAAAASTPAGAYSATVFYTAVPFF